jgi:methionyl aminopeptidase
VGFELKSRSDLGYMREAAKVVSETLKLLGQASVAGTTLRELDKLARSEIARHRATSSFLGYKPGGLPPYPAVLCASLNDVVVHGIPDETRLSEGDIISLDFGVHVKGFHADSARTFAVGRVSPERQRLIDVTRTSLERAAAMMSPAVRVGDLGHAIQTCVEGEGFSVVRDFVGHGIGRRMHEEPQVPNYGAPHRLVRLRPGLVLALEPMVNAGSWEVEVMPDGWTVRTKDRSDSAHFEDTVALTEDGPEVLTAW